MKDDEKNFLEILKLFGNVDCVEINQDEYVNSYIKPKSFYAFSCNTKKIFKKDNILSSMGLIKFGLILWENDECSILSFRVGTQEGVEDNILYIINEINRSSEYGKFILSNGDIDWEYRFDINHVERTDIMKILTSFFESLLRLVVIMRKFKYKEKEDIINE